MDRLVKLLVTTEAGFWFVLGGWTFMVLAALGMVGLVALPYLIANGVFLAVGSVGSIILLRANRKCRRSFCPGCGYWMVDCFMECGVKEK